MNLFHCHHPLSENSLSTLLRLIQATDNKTIILFREDAVNALNDEALLNNLKKSADIMALNTALSTQQINLLKNKIHLINEREFVTLCADAENVIAWK